MKIIFLLFALSLPAFADITLVKEGQPQAVIIVPEGLYRLVQKPAEQLSGDP